MLDINVDILEPIRRSPSSAVPKSVVSAANNVYEVVRPKMDWHSLALSKGQESLEDLLPYSWRNDQFESVGSAFRLSDGKWVSALHVFDLETPWMLAPIF